MKTKKIFVLVAMAIVLVGTFSFTQVAQADGDDKEHTFKISNKTREDVTVTLTADGDVQTFHVEGGKVLKEEVKQDTYLIEYTTCGTNYDWKLELKDDYTLVLYPCNAQPTKMQVKSHLHEEVELIIDGYEDYEVDIEPGVKQKVELFSGHIYYEYEACDGQLFSGEMNVAKNGTSQLILHSCEWHLSPARNYALPNPVKFRIINHASFPVIMTLIGPESYLVTADPGVNIFTLISGSYKFSYYQDAQLITGNMVVTPNGIGVLVITPSYVMDYVDDTGDLE
jgi:hypothetical protein